MLREGDRIQSERRTEIFTAMVECVAYLERFIDDLLLTSKVGDGEATAADEVTCEATDVAETAETARDRRVGRDHTDRELRVAITDTACDGGAVAWADPLRVSQVRDKLEAILDRFQRLEDPQRMVTKRLGLGLYVRPAPPDHGHGRAARRHQPPRIGLSFVVTLPAATAPTSPPATAPPQCQ